MFVKAKQSGELLSREKGELWTPDGVLASASKISRAHKQRERLDIEGLAVISGAGNIIRGEKLRDHHIAKGAEDVLGRLATIQNTLVLAVALRNEKVPTQVFLAKSMGFRDETLGTIEPYDLEAEMEAYKAEMVVLIAGGTGEDNKTTDNAVLHYAATHTEAWPDDDVVVLKGTKVDGVYEGDPMENAEAQRYSVISAEKMLSNYEKYSVVDIDCLKAIRGTGISMRVYRDGQHDLDAALNGSAVGTLIIPEGESVLA